MKHWLVALCLLATASASSAAGTRQIEKAFKAAFGKASSVILKEQGQYRESVKYTPVELVEAPFGPVLISHGEVIDATHSSNGKIAIIYLRRTPRGYAVVRRFVPAVEDGTYGVIEDWSVSRRFGSLPIVTVQAGGIWQGYACSWVTLVELTPAGPRRLVLVPLSYADDGSGKSSKFEGEITHIVRGRSFDVTYSGSKRFTERYLRRGNRYILSGRRQTRMPTC